MIEKLPLQKLKQCVTKKKLSFVVEKVVPIGTINTIIIS